jgi:hypothetical protein
MSMSESQMKWMMAEKNAGRLACEKCGRRVDPDEETASVGWPDGTFKVFCDTCADEIRPVRVDHYELLDTRTGESERVDPWQLY